jgi:adenosylmethionine-8-amino-7-oxononanoate aminotransferase
MTPFPNKKEDTLNQLKQKIEILQRWLKLVLSYKHVGDTRSAGLMAAVEILKDKETSEPYPFEDKIGWRIVLDVRGKGVFLRPLGDCIVIMPPLAISAENLTAMLSRIEESIIAVTEERP